MNCTRCLALIIAALPWLPVGATAAMLNPGDIFPSWQLVDQSGKTVSSADLAGSTYLLWFYPKAMTSGCTAEGQGLRDSSAGFAEKKVTILGVSFDDPKANAEFVKEQGFPFRLLSDTDHALALRVGAAESRDQQVARRISYLVGPDGKVVKAYTAVNPGTHAREVLNDLGAASR